MTNGDQAGTRAERLSMPLARDVVKELAIENGGCLRPVQLRRTDLATGEVSQVLVPCGHTLASVCPPCAERAKTLRAVQCREGWHPDQRITDAIDSHVQAERGKDDDDGAAGALVPAG